MLAVHRKYTVKRVKNVFKRSLDGLKIVPMI